jgi:hypothetical protein
MGFSRLGSRGLDGSPPPRCRWMTKVKLRALMFSRSRGQSSAYRRGGSPHMAESTDVEGIFFFLKCHVESIAMGTGRNVPGPKMPYKGHPLCHHVMPSKENGGCCTTHERESLVRFIFSVVQQRIRFAINNRSMLRGQNISCAGLCAAALVQQLSRHIKMLYSPGFISGEQFFVTKKDPAFISCCR